MRVCALSLFASLAANVTMTTALAAQREVEGKLMVLGVMERETDRDYPQMNTRLVRKVDDVMYL